MKRSETWGERAAIVAETYEAKKEMARDYGKSSFGETKAASARCTDARRRDLS
jgi:hypothetical protein